MKPERVDQIFAACFTRDELAFLKTKSEFTEAMQKIENIPDMVKAIEIGERLISETWSKDTHSDSKFTPKNLDDSD